MVTHFVVTTKFQMKFAVGACAVQFARDLAALGYHVEIICSDFDESLTSEFNIHHFASGLPFSIQQVVLTSFVAWKIRDNSPVHSFELPIPGSASFHLHSDIWNRTKTSDRISLRRAVRWLAKRKLQGIFRASAGLKTLVVPSAALLKIIEKKVPSNVEVFVLPNVLGDRSIFDETSRQSTEPLESIGFVAHGDLRYKGLLKVQDWVANNLPNYLLSWAGGKNPKNDPRRALEEVGTLERQEYASWLHRQSGVIIGSEFESFSMVALEALNSGKPVLSLGTLGLSEFVNHTDLLFDEGSQNEFKKAVLTGRKSAQDLNARLFRLRRTQLKSLIERFK